MSDLTSLPAALGRLLWSVFKEVVQLTLVPWHFRLYCESVDAPAIPTNLLDQMDALERLEDGAGILADALDIFDQWIEVWKLENAPPGETEAQSYVRVTDAMLRFFLPFVVVVMKRTPEFRYWAWIPTLFAMIDERIAAQVPDSFLVERIATLLKGSWGEIFRDHEEDQRLVGLALGTYVFLLVIDQILKWKPGINILGPESHEMLPGWGWESDLPAAKVGVEEPPRPLPVWMAQRTVSLRWEKRKMFDSSYFDAPEKFDELYRPRVEDPILGLTMVPIPTAAGGPEMWLQLDSGLPVREHDLGNGIRLRVRSHGDVGLRVLFGSELPPVAAGGGIDVELSYTPDVPAPDPKATAEGGKQGGVELSVGGITGVFFAGGGFDTQFLGDDIGIALRVAKARLTLTPKSRVVGELVKRSMTLSFDAGLLISAREGIVLEGGAGLELYLALRQKLGNKWAGLELSYIRLAIEHMRKADGAKLAFTGTFGITFNFMRMSLILDGIGLRFSLDTGRDHRDGNLLRLGHVEGDLVPPTGYGLKIDWGDSFRGGGFFKYEPTIDRFSGVVEISLGGKWTLRGVGFTEPREGGGTTTLVSVTFEVDSLPSPGFSPTGFGLLIGLHRRADGDAMRDALPTGGIDALLFPTDPLGRSAELVQSLATMFPAAAADDDTHVGGLLLRGSFAGGRVVMKIGFIVQFGLGTENRSKLFVAASIKTVFPPPLDRVLYIEIVGLGEYDAASGDIEIRAQLRNSRLCGADLEGGLVVFRGDPDPNDADPNRGLFASLGGYHPRYYNGQGPLRARVDKRLRIVLSRGNAIKVECAFYIAATPSSFHLGLEGRLEVHAGGFGLSGKAWLDGMTSYSFDDFTIDAGGSLTLYLFARTVASLELKGHLTGAHPVRLSGSVSFTVLWWTVSKSFGEPLTTSTEQPSLEAIDVAARVLDAIDDPASYPAQRPALVTLTQVERAGVWSSPEQPLRFLQKVAPLDTRIERIGPTPLPVPLEVHLESVTIGASTFDPPRALGEFAPGLYLSLDKEAALAAPVAEHWPAGFDAAGDAVACGEEQAAVAEYDEVIVDREYKQPPAGRPRRRLPEAVLAVLVELRHTVNKPIQITRPVYTSKVGASTFATAWADRIGFVRRAEDRT